MRIDDCIKDFLVELEIRNYTKATQTGYKSGLKKFSKYCVDHGIEDIEQVTHAVTKQYSLFMLKEGRKGNYINMHLKLVKGFIKYCYDEEYGGFNVEVKKIKKVKEEKPVITAFSVKDVKLMLENCKGNSFLDLRDTAILTLFFETGIRLQEMCKIKENDIFETHILINGKNNKQRIVPITPMFKKAMFRYARVRDSYFRNKIIEDNFFLSVRGRKLTNAGVEHMLKKRGKGIEGVRVSPHTCRHFFAQQQIKMGTDIYTISRLLGHENIAITQTYLNSLSDKEIVNIARNNSVLMNM